MIFFYIKKLIPPIFIDLFHYFQQNKRKGIHWSGNYLTWKEARLHCSGYVDNNILNRCKNALLQVKYGYAAYERDGVLFDDIHYSWALLAMIQRIAMENNGELSVIDFGGSLGSSYFQNKDFLQSVKNLKWCIVEQTHFVECGKYYFEDEYLHFYYSIEECLIKNKRHVLLLSSVLAYLEQPELWINKFIDLDFPYIIVDRTAFVDNKQNILTIQYTKHQSTYSASYPAWFFNIDNFKSLFSDKYTLLSQFDNNFTPPIELNGKKAFWNGLIYKRNE